MKSQKTSCLGLQKPETFFHLSQQVCFRLQTVIDQDKLVINIHVDLILSDDENTVSSVTSLPPLGKSDHIVIEFVYWCYCTIESRSVSKYLYNRGDYMSMTRELLNTDWEVL